ncbi:hypothetical protein [Glycomyces sp. NPDC021274]|uniref:hypothetical protein n=1 Tax=Glycomyces sp. NPDC021274 TaxID=3155120 RepID=UPI0033FB4F28
MSKQVALDYAEHTNWLLDSALKDAERYRRLAAGLVLTVAGLPLALRGQARLATPTAEPVPVAS